MITMWRRAAACASCLLLPGMLHSQSDLNWMYAAPPLEKMVAESSLIAVGVADSSWVEIVTGLAIPITVYPFKVEEVLYGEPLVDSLRSLTVGCPGGRDPRTGSEDWVSHAAQMNPGVRNVVFLQKLKLLIVPGEYEHFGVTEGYWGVSGITRDDVLAGGPLDGQPLEIVRAQIMEAAQAKSPYSLLNRADALVRAKIGPTEVVARPDGHTRMTVTQVTVLEWLKGEGEDVVTVHEEQTITRITTWKDRVELPEAQTALIFLEKQQENWRVLDGPNGLFCIDSDGELFSPELVSDYRDLFRIRPIGLTESKLRAVLKLDQKDK